MSAPEVPSDTEDDGPIWSWGYGPGPWYDGQKVKEIERTTGIKFEAK